MSILITGIDMPTDDFALSLDIHRDGRVEGHWTCTIKGAKAVEIAPHEDLIERDALIRNLLPMQTNPRFQRIKRGFAKAIAVAKDLPVIIPADK